MNPQTRYIGIDLGTTNSAVARLEGTNIRVFRNKNGDEYTPSALHFSKNSRLTVGRVAYETALSDPENVAIEFKRNMGSPNLFTFKNSGLTMRPEELSAEVLKSLRSDVERATQEGITHAIITVPAYFNQPACQATVRAAILAGMTVVETLVEPVAAAMAHGLERIGEDAYWMVYDFGGGTFDTAIIHARHGALTVVKDGGDNQLGGKNIDWDIVEKILLPKVAKQTGFSDIKRGDPKWATAIAKLKICAEQSKKDLSADDETFVVVENIQPADGRHSYTLECTISRSEVNSVARPWIERSIVICKKVLQEAGIPAGNIEKLILVGGPTMMPLVRDMLSDMNIGL